jgi:hypothetical protein
MFTINIYLRFALIALGLVGGILLSAAYGFWYGFPFILIAILLLAGYLMLGTIMSTNVLLGQMRFDEAEARLKMTFFPRILLVGYRGVFYMTQAAIHMQRKEWNTSEELLKKALNLGLPSDNERGAALLQLMMIGAQKGNRNLIPTQMAELKKLNITEPNLKAQIKDVEQQLKLAKQNPMNPSTLAMMGGRNGFRQGSGKRPRPRMR